MINDPMQDALIETAIRQSECDERDSRHAHLRAVLTMALEMVGAALTIVFLCALAYLVLIITPDQQYPRYDLEPETEEIAQ